MIRMVSRMTAKMPLSDLEKMTVAAVGYMMVAVQSEHQHKLSAAQALIIALEQSGVPSGRIDVDLVLAEIEKGIPAG